MKNRFILTCVITAILLTTIIPATVATDALEITNLSLETYNFTYQQLTEMSQLTEYAELFCYGNLVASGQWSGVQLSYLLTQANLTSEVNSIQLTASDSYVVTIPIQTALAPDTIIAYQQNGKPLSGLRLVLPEANGAAWINQIVSITMRKINVDPPQTAAGAGLSANIAASINNNRQMPPTPSPTVKPTEPADKPTPDNSQLNPTVTPSNITSPMQIFQQQITKSQLISSDNSIIALIATLVAVGLTITAIVTYKSKSSRTKIVPGSSIEEFLDFDF